MISAEIAAKNRSAVPAIISNLGDEASWRFLEFFTARIQNKNTRLAYLYAVRRFTSWCEISHLNLISVRAFHVAAYIEELELSAPSIKQHLAAIRMLFDYLLTGNIIESNPASGVRGPKYVIKKGKTPVLSGEEARTLLSIIDDSRVIGARDKALIGLMIYSFARISAVLKMRVKDYFLRGKKHWIRLHEKGGRYHEIPVHHRALEFLDHYLDLSGLREDKDGFLFRAGNGGRSQQLKLSPLSRFNAIQMVKRHAKNAGISQETCCHSFRATGITAFLSHGGSIEHAQNIAAHESPRTTKLYDRRSEEIDQGEIERIIL